MTDHKHRQLRELFEQALELSTEQRSSFLSARCAEQPELRQRVEALLAAAEDERFLASPTGAAPGATAPPPTHEAGAAAAPALALGVEQPGAHIGPYKLLQLIGEGGSARFSSRSRRSRCGARWRSRSSSSGWTRARSSRVSSKSAKRWR